MFFFGGAGADPVAAQRGDVSLDRAGNAFGTVSVIAGSAALRDADGFALTASDLSGRLILGGGGVASLRNDPQAKAWAQLLLDMPIPVPRALADSLTGTGPAS